MAKYQHKFTPWRARDGQRVVAAESHWKLPLRWNRSVDKDGERRRVEVTYDVFEDRHGPMVGSDGGVLWHGPNGIVPAGQTPARNLEKDDLWRPATMQDARARLFRLIDQTPNLDWLLLTKRPEYIARFWVSANYRVYHGRPWPCEAGGCTREASRVFRGPGRDALYCTEHGFHRRHNVWLGVSVENQQTADERIPHLLRVPAAVRFLSVEPLLGPVDLAEWFGLPFGGNFQNPLIGDPSRFWVIVGGESGHGARPMHPDWVRSIRDQCLAAGVPFFFTQWGEWLELGHGDADRTLRDDHPEFSVRLKMCDGFVSRCGHFITDWSNAAALVEYRGLRRVGKKAAGATIDGREWREVPNG